MKDRNLMVKMGVNQLFFTFEFCGDLDKFEILSKLRVLSNVLISKFDF